MIILEIWLSMFEMTGFLFRKNGKRRVQQLTNTYEKINEIDKDSSHINSKKVLKMDTSKG